MAKAKKTTGRKKATTGRRVSQGGMVVAPAAVGARYRQKLRRIVQAMTRDYTARIMSAWTATFDAPGDRVKATLEMLRSKWGGIFDAHSATLANSFVTECDAASAKVTERSIAALAKDVTLRPPKFTKKMQALLDRRTKENVDLIRNLAEEHYQKISKVVLESIQSGGQKRIYDELMQIGGMTGKRADLIAVDQTRKLNAEMNSARMQSAGLKKFTWHSSTGSAQPRPLHAEYDGEVFEFENPPIIDERTGETGLPGMAINCRCSMTPIVELDEVFE